MTKTIAELVECFAQGDQEAFAELVRRYEKRIYSLAYHILHNHLDADEVVQETFVRIYKKREELANVRYFSTFLLRIAANYAIDLMRRSRGRVGIESEEASSSMNVWMGLSRQVATPGEELENKELWQEIQNALRLLPPRQRLTAILHDVEGYSTSEIAAALNSPEATVRSNLHIARKKLRVILTRRLAPR
ncbi:MAG TPA: RNA polymerase sigma factor [Candidatus Deferrimicrobium sp.]|nr:RNA polymerase sigma factor [Candidatus Deferrimicrobium sp.]